jgi:hypothetical protein
VAGSWSNSSVHTERSIDSPSMKKWISLGYFEIKRL